jgi:hypothetical protein
MRSDAEGQLLVSCVQIRLELGSSVPVARLGGLHLGPDTSGFHFLRISTRHGSRAILGQHMGRSPGVCCHLFHQG